MTVKYLEFTQRFAVFDEAAFLNYARTFGDVVDHEGNHERKLIAGVMVIAGNSPHPHTEPRVNTAIFRTASRVRWSADGRLTFKLGHPRHRPR